LQTFPWWTERQKELIVEVEEFADEHFAAAEKYTWKKEIPWSILKAIAEKGWFGAMISEEYGGCKEELGCTGCCIINEGISRLGTLCFIYGETFFGGAHQLEKFGTEEQKRRWLPDIASGKKFGAICITEPFVGSDAAGVKTEARREGDEYVITGKKRFTTGLGISDIYMLYAKTSDDPADRAANRHLTGFIVEKGMPGFTVEKLNELCGLDGIYNGYLNLDEVRVPVENRLGNEGGGWNIMLAGLNLERTITSAQTLGGMREAIRFALFHSRRRVQFDRPTISFQINQFKIADMIMRLNNARLLTYYAAYLIDRGEGGIVGPAIEATCAKLYNALECVKTADDAMQIMGGDGYSRFYPVELGYRNAKMAHIGAGTNEVMRMILYRLGVRLMESEFRPPIRIIDNEIGVALDHLSTKLELEKEKISEKSVLRVLAEDYRANPGLYMAREDLLQRLEGTEEELDEVLLKLEEKKLVALNRDRRGVIALAKATYWGLKEANPPEYYRWYPTWAKMEELF